MTPHTSDAEHSSWLQLFAPRCIATRDEEHAVSILMEGPLRSKQNETRPDATLNAEAFALYALPSSLRDRGVRSEYYDVDIPTNTDLLDSLRFPF